MIGRTSLVAALTVAVMTPGLRPAFSEAPQRPPQRLEPDPELQRAIQRALNPKNEEDLKAQMEQLHKLGGPSLEKLIPQLLYYTMHGRGPAGEHDVKEGMALGIIGRQLDIPPASVFTALVRLLETDEPGLQKEVRNLLSGFEFSYFASRVSGDVYAGRNLQGSLVAYMYEREPGKSMLTLTSAFLLSVTPLPPANREKFRSLLWAEHVIADTLWKHEHGFLPKSKVEPEAMAELEKLSKDEAWWVRLYAATILNKAPAFRRPDIVARLDKDSHPLVREAMGFIQQQQPPPPRTAPKESPFGPPPPPRAEKRK